MSAPLRTHRILAAMLLVYGAASLLHFTHNAEFVPDYPGLPETWTRSGVYLAWLGMTAVGIAGWLAFTRGWRIAGLVVLAEVARQLASRMRGR